jgi:hypothetical protein
LIETEGPDDTVLEILCTCEHIAHGGTQCNHIARVECYLADFGYPNLYQMFHGVLEDQDEVVLERKQAVQDARERRAARLAMAAEDAAEI